VHLRLAKICYQHKGAAVERLERTHENSVLTMQKKEFHKEKDFKIEMWGSETL
jgi:hypothetical protein